jgi:adenine-specific DNA-methyltransferase
MTRLKNTVLEPADKQSDGTSNQYGSLTKPDLIRLLERRDEDEIGGIRLHYKGQTPPWLIVRQVRPRRQKIESKLSVGSEEAQSDNQIIEGENLQAMVSLYKYRGQVDMIITDPPYNTGQDFRYNDKWDKDPNDPDLGNIVPKDDGSRHSKWLRFMTPRLWMMKEMLKPSGVIAVFIGDDELHRLGMLMDNIFGENNRLGIINWQKIYSTKRQAKHLANATEYVLLYEKIEAGARRQGLISSSSKTRTAATNPDNDPEGPWSSGNPTGPGGRPESADYGLQSPDDGHMYYPAANRHWAWEKSKIKRWVEEWGVKYEEISDPNCHQKSLVIKGSSIRKSKVYTPPALLAKAQRAAVAKRKGVWPFLYFTGGGKGRPMNKMYRKLIARGEVPMTYWAHEEYDRPIYIGSASWSHGVVGTSKRGTTELQHVMGDKMVFETVKPLELIEKIVHLWCPRAGLVLDPFAGSGTTGHAILNLNKLTRASRRFILIEQGRPERGDPYARALTAERVKRAISGQWATGKKQPLVGGFRFTQLTKAVDADAVLALEREEMIDLLLTSHWDQAERSAAYLKRFPAGAHGFLFANNNKSNGYFLIWNGPGKPAVLDRAAFRTIVEEAKAANLNQPYHVYARICTYSGPNIEFYQIPDRILDKLGFNEATQPFRID